MFPGIGTLVNVVTVLLGTVIGVLVGHRLTQRTRDVVTDGLGLVTLLIAALSAASITDASWAAAVGDSAPMLIVLGSLSPAASSARCSGSRTGSRASAAGSRPACTRGPAAARRARTGSGSSRGSSRARWSSAWDR